MACICDAYSSLYYRHKPILDDDDYDIDFYTADPISSDGAPSPREQLEVRHIFLLENGSVLIWLPAHFIMLFFLAVHIHPGTYCRWVLSPHSFS